MLRFSATDRPRRADGDRRSGACRHAEGSGRAGGCLTPCPTASFWQTPSGKVVFSNTAAEAINGIRREQITGLSLGALAKRSSIDWTAMTDAFHDRKRKIA